MKTLTKLTRLFKSFTNDVLDKAYDPVSDAKQAQRDIENEINNIMKRGTDVITPSRKMNEKKAHQFNTQAQGFYDKAAEFKLNGNAERSKEMIDRYLRVKEMADQYLKAVGKQKQQEERLKDIVRELVAKKDSVAFEIDMMEARKDIADSNIHYHEKIEGGSESIQEVLKKARGAVDKLEFKSEALEEWSDVRPKEETPQKALGSDVEDLYNKL